MLRRLNVRTRLVAVIAVPLVLLLAVVVPEAVQRRGLAADKVRSACSASTATETSATCSVAPAARSASSA